jgi:hypothetical protein
MNEEINIKEAAFYKITQWLSDYGFQVNISTKNNNSNAEIQFEAEVYPSKESPMFFYLTFGKDLRDGFSTIANMDLPEEIQKAINALVERDQQQIYMDIRKLVYPLNINCDTRFPRITLHKLIFIDSLKEKQFFFDCVFNLINAMQLISATFDETYYSLYPKGG